MIEQLTPAAKQRLTQIAGFEVEAASVLSLDGNARLSVIFEPCLSMVIAVPAGAVDALMVDGKIKAFLDEEVPVVLAFERASDAHRLGVMLEGGGTA